MPSATRLRALLANPLVVSLAIPFLLVQLTGFVARFIWTSLPLPASGDATTFASVYGATELAIALSYSQVLSRAFGLRLGFTAANLARSCFLLVPVIGLIALQLFEVSGGLVYALGDSARVLSCLLVAAGAGQFEELAWRSASIGSSMRAWHGKKWRLDAALLVSSLSFALIHFSNLLHGADLGYTLVQVFYTFGLGVTLGASYLRTRNVTMPVALHFLLDFISLLASGTEVTEAINRPVSADVTFTLARIGAVLLVWGLICLRPSVRKQALCAWDDEDEGQASGNGAPRFAAELEELGRREMAGAEEELVELLLAEQNETEGQTMANTSDLEKVRKHYRFVGQVQGVGFRFTISSLANRVGATGWVMNEPDGSVTAEVQGNQEQVVAVIQGLTQHFNTGRRWFRGFTIDDMHEVPVKRGEADFRPIY